MDGEKIAYASLDGVHGLLGVEREALPGIVGERDRMFGETVVQIFDAEHQGRALIHLPLPIDASAGRPPKD